ncbi:MAG TPA: hypothetical protein VLO10_04455 [Candidatus Deferrimicrobium sp.]|nr:hypothetical protein [Candidatus Deferrimicrobium sp.]
MKRLSLSSILLLVGGVVILVGLLPEWSTVATLDGAISVSLRGIDYASYDITTTALLGVLLVAAAFAVAAGRRWGQLLGVIVAVFACLWGALVMVAAANPSADGTALSGVKVSIGLGAFGVAAGALLALIGAVMSFRGRTVSVVTSGVASSV